MKVAALAQSLAPALPLLRCPLCGMPFRLEGTSLRCESRHCFDLSARGYVNLAPGRNQSADPYDTALFQSRNRIFAAGFYRPVLDAIAAMLERCFGDAPFSLADAGCGEGYYAKALCQRFPQSMCFGLDLSRDGIAQAARGGNPVRWLVADVKRLPFADASLDVVLDVLTPADYGEFRRVLKPGGQLIKAIPGQRYLCQARDALREHLRHGEYDNGRVLRHLEENAAVLERQTVCQTVPLTPAQSADLLRMTPLTFSVPEAALEGILLPEITLHMELVRCELHKMKHPGRPTVASARPGVYRKPWGCSAKPHIAFSSPTQRGDGGKRQSCGLFAEGESDPQEESETRGHRPRRLSDRGWPPTGAGGVAFTNGVNPVT